MFGAIPLGQEALERLTQQVFPRVAKRLLRESIHEDNVVVLVHHDDGARRGLDSDPELLVRPLAIGDIGA